MSRLAISAYRGGDEAVVSREADVARQHPVEHNSPHLGLVLVLVAALYRYLHDSVDHRGGIFSNGQGFEVDVHHLKLRASSWAHLLRLLIGLLQAAGLKILLLADGGVGTGGERHDFVAVLVLLHHLGLNDGHPLAPHAHLGC